MSRLDPRLRGDERFGEKNFATSSSVDFSPAHPREGGDPDDARSVVAFFTYILASQRNGALYVGSTEDLIRRIGQHKSKTFDGFTAQHGIEMLVWYQMYDTREDAFRREHQIKKWNRPWKLRMIEAFNPDWLDLYDTYRRGVLRDASDWVPPVEDPGNEETHS